MQNQVVCSGCITLLLYPRGATNVCCALCNTVTSVPPTGMELARLICGGCRTLLMHPREATSVRCSCCQTVNLVPGAAAPPLLPPPSGTAHINCGNCRTMLMYPAGAPLVKCAICQFITNVRAMIPVVDNFASSTTMAPSRSQSQTVVVQNPMTVDQSGKLVSNVVVGVTT